MVLESILTSVCKKRQKIDPDQRDSKQILNESKLFPWSSKISQSLIYYGQAKVNSRGHFFSKWRNSSGHFHRENSSGNFSRIFVDIYCPQEFLFFGEFSWTFFGVNSSGHFFQCNNTCGQVSLGLVWYGMVWYGMVWLG